MAELSAALGLPSGLAAMGVTDEIMQHIAGEALKHENLQQRADGAHDQSPRDDAEKPVARCVRDVITDVGAQQIERAVRQIDVAHQSEDKREAAGDEKVEAGERNAVKHGADKGFLAVEKPFQPLRPDAEHHPEEDRGRKNCERDPRLAGADAFDGVGGCQAHAINRRRCSLIFGALWN